jgi:hypothetical protein
VHGIVSPAVVTTPMNGRAIASSSRPMPRMNTRCGARIDAVGGDARAESCCYRLKGPGKQDMKQTRKKHNAAFKAKVALADSCGRSAKKSSMGGLVHF